MRCVCCMPAISLYPLAFFRSQSKPSLFVRRSFPLRALRLCHSISDLQGSVICHCSNGHVTLANLNPTANAMAMAMAMANLDFAIRLCSSTWNQNTLHLPCTWGPLTKVIKCGSKQSRVSPLFCFGLFIVAVAGAVVGLLLSRFVN